MGRASVQKLIDEGSDALKMALSDLDGSFSPLQLDEATLDPAYSYYWAVKDDNRHPAHVDKLRRLGYRFVNKENNSGEVAPFAEVQTAENGAIQTSDLILMRLPIELYEARQAKVIEIGKERLVGYNEEAKEKIQRVKGALLKETD